MSKAQLRKELLTFDANQLREIILNAYDSSPKAKEYFEFFLNPDVDALMQKRLEAIIKEVNRTKWGECKARISVIRREIKEFACFGVGVEKYAMLVYFVFRVLLGQSKYYILPPPLRNGMLAFAAEYVTLAAKNDFLEPGMKNMKSALDQLGSAGARFECRKAINDALKSLDINITQ